MLHDRISTVKFISLQFAMTTIRTETGINLCDMTVDEAGLIVSAVLLLAEQTGNAEHARILRRAGMQIDEQLPK